MTRTWLKIGNVLIDPETIESVNLRSFDSHEKGNPGAVVVFFKSGHHEPYKGPAADALRAYFSHGPLGFPTVEVEGVGSIIDLMPIPAATTEATS